MVKAFTLSFLLSISSTSLAGAAGQRNFHALAAFGTNYSFPGSVRVGWKDWEVGMLTPSMYGVDKLFDLTTYTHAAFGVGLSYSQMPAFFGAIGFSYSWWKIGVRGELTSVFDLEGFSQGIGILGVSYGF